jgi:uncharacterized LabA/DUF88 family protein
MTKEKVKVYIDGSNTFHAQKKLGWMVDWVKVKKYLIETYDIIEFKYYTGLKDGDEATKSFLRYLSKVGVNVVTKPLKKILLDKNDLMFAHSKDGYVYKANFDVEMTADMLLETEGVNRIIIFSGDSDFAYLVKKLKSLGKGVTIVSSRKTIAWELKLERAEVIFLEDREHQIRKT